MLRSLLWAGLGVGGQQVLRLVVVLVLARLLTPEDFGIVAVAQILLTFADVLQQMGLGSALVQSDRLTKRLERSAATAVLVSSAIMAAALYLATPLFADWFNTPELSGIMPVLLCAFMLTSINGPSIMLLNREMRFRELAIGQLVTFLFGYGGVAIGLALSGWTYWSMVWGTLAQAALMFVVAHWLRPVWPTVRPSWEDLKGLLNFGGGMLLSQLLNKLARRGDHMIVAASMGPVSLGLYSRAYALMDMANQLFGTVFYKVLFPVFSERRRAGASAQARNATFLASHFFVAALMVPVSALMSLCAPELVMLLLGAQWTKAIPVLSILGAAMYFRLAYKVSWSFIAAEGAVYRGALAQGVYAAQVLAGAWFGSQYGLVGVAVGITIALVCQHVILSGLAASLTEGTFAGTVRAMAAPLVAGAIAFYHASVVRSWLFGEGGHPVLILVMLSLAYSIAYFPLLALFTQRFSPPGIDFGSIWSHVRATLFERSG